MAETTIDARVTMYGFPDNDPPFSANIAHPVLHQQASGIGTFDDPITFAGDPGDIPFGTKIYVPHVQKYFIMEDTAAAATASPNDGLLVDLWAGGSANTDVQQLLSVENANTRSSAPVILNAEPGHPVDLTPFDGSPTPSTAAQTPASAATADAVSELLASIPAQDPSAKTAHDPALVSTAPEVTTPETASNAVSTSHVGDSALHSPDDTFQLNWAQHPTGNGHHGNWSRVSMPDDAGASTTATDDGHHWDHGHNWNWSQHSQSHPHHGDWWGA